MPTSSKAYERIEFGRAAQLGLGALLLVATFGLQGCCALGGCAPASMFPTARAAIDAMRGQQQCSRALRGEARLDYFGDAGRAKVSAFFMSQHPQNLRFDLVSPFGTPLATLTSNNHSFALLDREHKVYYVGPAAECNVERFLKVPIPPEALVQLLAGEAPVLVHEPGDAQIEWSGGRYVVRIASKHGAQQVIEFEVPREDRELPYDQQRLRLRQVRVSQQGVELYRVELRDYARAAMAGPRVDPEGIEADLPPSGPQCQAEAPHRLRFVIPISDQDVAFDQKELEHNPPLIESAFTQQPPPGVRIERSLCEVPSSGG